MRSAVTWEIPQEFGTELLLIESNGLVTTGFLNLLDDERLVGGALDGNDGKCLLAANSGAGGEGVLWTVERHKTVFKRCGRLLKIRDLLSGP